MLLFTLPTVAAQPTWSWSTRTLTVTLGTSESVSIGYGHDAGNSEYYLAINDDGGGYDWGLNNYVKTSDVRKLEIIGGSGANTIDVSDISTDPYYWHPNLDGNITLRGRGGDDHITGSSLNDLIYAGAGVDTIDGRGGRNRLLDPELIDDYTDVLAQVWHFDKDVTSADYEVWKCTLPYSPEGRPWPSPNAETWQPASWMGDAVKGSYKLRIAPRHECPTIHFDGTFSSKVYNTRSTYNQAHNFWMPVNTLHAQNYGFYWKPNKLYECEFTIDYKGTQADWDDVAWLIPFQLHWGNNVPSWVNGPHPTTAMANLYVHGKNHQFASTTEHRVLLSGETVSDVDTVANNLKFSYRHGDEPGENRFAFSLGTHHFRIRWRYDWTGANSLFQVLLNGDPNSVVDSTAQWGANWQGSAATAAAAKNGTPDYIIAFGTYSSGKEGVEVEFDEFRLSEVH